MVESKKFRSTILLDDVPKVPDTNEGSVRWFTRFFDVEDVTWRFAFRLCDREGEDKFDFSIHCYYETRAAFIIRTMARFRVVHPEDDDIADLSHYEYYQFDGNNLNEYTHEVFGMDSLTDYIVNGTIQVEFELEVIQFTSNVLPRPQFTEVIEYNDVCLRTPDKSFFVASSVLKLRSRVFDEMIENPERGQVYEVDDDAEKFEQLLKLLYYYQDDVNASNVENLLELCTAYDCQECIEMLERYLLRTPQLDLLEKLTLAQQFDLNHLMGVTIQAFDQRWRFNMYSACDAFDNLPNALKKEIEDQVVREEIGRYDLLMNVETNSLNNHRVTSYVEKYNELSVTLSITPIVIQDTPLYWVSIDCFGCESEYFMVRMTIDLVVGTARRQESSTINVFMDNHTKTIGIIAPQPPQDQFTANATIRIDDFRHKFHRPRNTIFTAPTPCWNAKILVNNEEFYVSMEVLASSSERFAKLFEGCYGSRKKFRFTNVNRVWFEESLQHIYHPGRSFNMHTFPELLVHFLRIESRRVMEEIDFYIGRVNITDKAKLGICKAGMLLNTLLICTNRELGINGLLDLTDENIDLFAVVQQGHPR